MKRNPRIHNKAHLDFIRGLPCLLCKDNTSTEAAHIRFADPTAGKRETGMGEKPHDWWTVPLCGECHRAQHEGSEKGFWGLLGVDPIRVALALWASTGDHAAGETIVSNVHIC